MKRAIRRSSELSRWSRDQPSRQPKEHLIDAIIAQPRPPGNQLANTARGAAHFLTETIGRVRQAGAHGALTVWADSGFYAHAVVAVCRRMKARVSITARL